MADSTTIDFTPPNSADDSPVYNLGVVEVYEKYLDASQINLAAASYALFDIPEGRVHLSTVVEVLTAEGGTATADIGITGGDVDNLIDGVNLNATAGTIYASGAAGTAEANSMGGASAGYVTPDGGVTFSLLANNALDAAKFRVRTAWLNMKGSLTQQSENSV